MASFPSNVGPGLFVPTTDIFDTSMLEGKDLSSPEFRQFLIVLTQRINEISLQLNLKDTGIYSEQEFVNSQVFFPNPALSSTTAQAPIQRQVFRKVYNFGALPNAGAKTLAHGITVDANLTFTRIYGTSSDTTGNEYIPIPFVNVGGTITPGNIEISLDATNIIVTTTGDGTAFDTTYVVVEYIKS